MKKLLIILLSFFSFAGISCVAQPDSEIIKSASDTLKVATYNVRIRTNSDTGNTNWKVRKPEVAKLINEFEFDVFGVQELIDKSQEDDLSDLLNSYASVSYGRDNQEGSKGERAAIYFLKSRFELLQKGFFFLSETPEKVSKGWDAALNRICLWTKLKDRITNKEFYFFNTHFDHVGVTARRESAKLITRKMEELAGSETVICEGDFNAAPNDTEFYNTITTKLKDSRLVSVEKPKGSVGTFNGWEKEKTDFPESVRIDYLFTQNVKVISYETINKRFGENEVPSDHFPVMIRCTTK